jgi:hypothetical protein
MDFQPGFDDMPGCAVKSMKQGQENPLVQAFLAASR